VPKDPAPDLLVDESNRVISHSARIYLPPIDSIKKFDLPPWLKPAFINNELRERCAKYLCTADQRDLRQKLSCFRVNEYALANIASAIIAEVRRTYCSRTRENRTIYPRNFNCTFSNVSRGCRATKLEENYRDPIAEQNGDFY
jgi:hypothetical protein